MGLTTQSAVLLTSRLARQVVASLVALALVGITVGECQCPTRATAADQCACCCPSSGPSTGTTLRASMGTQRCGTAVGETALGESLAKPDRTFPAKVAVEVAALHEHSTRLPVALLVEAPPLVRSSRHPILRI